MPAPCYYHPGTDSTGVCAQCGMPICALDTEMVAGKPVCKNCVAAVRARVEREMPRAPDTEPYYKLDQMGPIPPELWDVYPGNCSWHRHYQRGCH
jgi:hypothetical protein